LSELGRVELVTGDHEAARPLLERALAVKEKALGPEHLDVAFPATRLAQLHSLAGEYERAEALFERSLAIREENLGPDHPDLTWTLRPYAEHLDRSGNRTRGRLLFERALTIAEDHWGPMGIEVSYILGEYSLLEHGDGHYTRARELRERALAIQIAAFGDRHWIAAGSLYNLARLEARLGEEIAALQHLGDAVKAGFPRARILDDPDFESLRGDPRFEALVAEVKSPL
jgi:tetratricopeptide (TPR) repeat protein